MSKDFAAVTTGCNDVGIAGGATGIDAHEDKGGIGMTEGCTTATEEDG